MTHPIALITDSTCDIPAEWRKQYHITVVPLTIIFGEQQYLDGVDLAPVAFYERLLRDSTRPTTSQPTPEDFLKAYRQAAAEGAEEIFTLTISSAMSGTMESARQAAAGSPVPVTLHDSRTNSMGLGWQVIAAARAREAGGDTAAMTAAAAAVREDISYFITLDTIEYLARGGRISGAAKFLNSLLNIKPIITVRTETGTVGAVLPARSRKGAIESLYREFTRRLRPGKPLHVTVLHNNALPEAEALAERVEREWKPAEMFIQIVSPVLGVHTGPGALALCGYSER